MMTAESMLSKHPVLRFIAALFFILELFSSHIYCIPSKHKTSFFFLFVDDLALCPQPMQLSELDMENCTSPESYDYFTGSEVSFALSFLAIGLFAVGG